MPGRLPVDMVPGRLVADAEAYRPGFPATDYTARGTAVHINITRYDTECDTTHEDTRSAIPAFPPKLAKK